VSNSTEYHDCRFELAALGMAKRLQKGELVEFKNEEEKAEVIKFAEEFAKRTATKLSERKGEAVEPVNMEIGGFEDADRKDLMGKMVRGDYQIPPKKGAGGLLQEVMKNLVNNGSYRGADSEMFMKKLEGLVAAPRRNTGAAQRAKK